MERTKESLYKGIEVAVEGKRVGDIGHAVQNYVEEYGYTVVGIWLDMDWKTTA